MIVTNFKTEEEIRWFLKGVPLKFHFRTDRILEFNSIIPLNAYDTEEKPPYNTVLLDVKVSFFDNEELDLFNYDTIDNILYKHKVFEVKLASLGGEYDTVYHCKYDGIDNELFEENE